MTLMHRQDDIQIPASIGVNHVQSENSVKGAQVLAVSVGECDIVRKEMSRR